MAKVKQASMAIFLLVHVQYCLVVSEIVTGGLSEVTTNAIIIDGSLESGNDEWARDSLTRQRNHLRAKRSVGQSRGISPLLYYNPPEEDSPAYLLGALEKMSSVHLRIYFYRSKDWEIMAVTLDELESEEKLSQPLKATVYVGDNEFLWKQAVAMSEMLRKRNVFLERLGFGYNLDSHRPILFDSIVRGIHVLCGYNFGHSSIQPTTAVQKTRESCGFVFDQAAAFQWELNIDYLKAAGANYSLEFFSEHVQQRLNDALLARNEIQVAKPNVSVELKLNSYNLPAKDPTFNFYCDERLLKINAYFEEIGSWSRNHNFPVLFFNTFPVFDLFPSQITWWSQVSVDKEVSQDITKNMPVYVLRNFDKSPDPNWNLDACVKWSAEVAQEGIQLDRYLNAVTVTMNLREEPINVGELENMLLFALQKFTTVELLPGKDAFRQLTDLKTFNALLETDFLEAMVDLDVQGGQLYIDISIEKTFFSETVEQVANLAERISKGPEAGLHLMGVHLTNWETETSPKAALEQVISLGSRYNFTVGLVVKNCASLLNKFATANSTYSVPFSDYILCPTKFIPADNKNKQVFATNLDTHLYVSKILEKFLPGRLIHFRINSFPCCLGDTKEIETENLLRFLNDVSQFAVGNKLKHFLVQAVTSSSLSRNSVSTSWFTIETYSDLSNASAFIDREEAFGNKSISHPPLKTDVLKGKLKLRKSNLHGSTSPPRHNAPNKEENIKGIAITNVLIFVIIVIIALVISTLGWLLYAYFFPHSLPGRSLAFLIRRRISALTKEEIDEFRDGCEMINLELADDSLVYIVTELCSNGSLLSHLHELDLSMLLPSKNVNKPKLHFELVKISHEIALGMEHIASKKVIHGDLSARNVLLDKNFTCKICDFGLSQKLYSYEVDKKEIQEPLPWRWCAIECLTKRRFSTKSDIWSYGITLWEIFSLCQLPYSEHSSWDDNFLEALTNGKRPARPKYAYQQIYDKMFECWNVDSSLRPQMTDMCIFFESLKSGIYSTVE